MTLSRRTVGVLLVGTAAFLVVGPAAARLIAQQDDQAPNRREFTVTAKDFHFSPSRLEVTQDDLVKLTVRSQDVAYSVTIDEYRNFYVNGMVEKPGGYPFSPGLTVRKAITLAGGFKERASREKINIIRDDDPKQIPRKVDLNAPVLPGDIVTIEESFF